MDDDDDEYDREADDEETGYILGCRHILDEIPPACLAEHARWCALLAFGAPDAVALHDQLAPGSSSEVSVYELADRIDMGFNDLDEIEAVKAIFGEAYADCVHQVLNDEYCDRREEYEYAVERIRGRIEAGCLTKGDRALIREDARRRVRDVELLALHSGDALRREVVRDGKERHVCHATGWAIPKKERHLVLTRFVDGVATTTQHSVVAAWVEVVMQEPAICGALQRENNMDR